MKAPICLLVSLALLCPLLLGCQAPSSAFGDTERIKVCATLFPQYEFARAIRVSRQTVSSIENGKYNPSLELAFMIAEYFGMKIEEIFLRERSTKHE